MVARMKSHSSLSYLLLMSVFTALKHISFASEFFRDKEESLKEENMRDSNEEEPYMILRENHYCRRFEYIIGIKNLERQQNLSKWKDERASTTRGLIDRGTAIREANFKGSLLDRIAALETRLFQICLELESSSASSTSTGGSGETSSQRIKKDLTKTLPIFSSNVNPFHVPLQHPQDPRDMEEKIEEEKDEEINLEKPLLEKKKIKKNDANETCNPKKKKKKTNSPKKWCRFSLLGC
ncbi:PREDICTED: uncharacterized protein LOC104724693 isoform X2 [Camelina sativa]|uniref:Uncharacterized protein LOC104724693 isoform X2 n=1 Tax=Camelina sativa TaxID=90675 RepID=A0ABM0UI93_CAMSA|nr:PREDICTED: uncharacterized protein LOC104724693 isoform X2 [Camelina sativa]